MPLLLLLLLGGLPQDRSKPPLPFYDWGACPFECCTYGMWTAREEVTVYARQRANAKIVGVVRMGETVHALTGVVITRKAGRVRIRKPVTLDEQNKLKLRPGDVLHTLRYIGEGHELFWFRGKTYSDQIHADKLPTVPPPPDQAWEVLEVPSWEWWVKVRLPDGTTGWINEISFIGPDACAAEWVPIAGVAGGFRRNVVGDPSAPGAFRFELQVPAGGRAEAHKHSIDVHVRVLSGSMFIIIGEPLDPARANHYRAGSTFVVPADAWHVEWWDEPALLEGSGIGPMITTRQPPPR